MTDAKDFGEFDFAAGSINGLRAFKVDSLGRLTGVTHESAWTPGENAAACDRSGAHIKPDPSSSYAFNAAMLQAIAHAQALEATSKPRVHNVPDRSCGCGFWAFYNGENDFAHPGTVTAVIEGYGRTIVGTKGFRSEKARILGLAYVTDRSDASDRAHKKAAWRKTYLRGLSWRIGIVIFGALFALALGLNQNWIGMTVNGILALLNAHFAVSFARRNWRDYLSPSCPTAMRFPMLHDDQWHEGRCDCSKASWRAKSSSTGVLQASTAQLLRRNYPDVPAFESLRDLLEAFPVQKPVEAELTPQSDPNFWTRSAS